jgi:DNA-binding XRE family transcriptional regulator
MPAMKLKVSKQEALDAFQNDSARMCEMLDVSKQAYWQWEKEEIPQLRALQIFWMLKTGQI